MPSGQETAEGARCRGSWVYKALAARSRRPKLHRRDEQGGNSAAHYQTAAIRHASVKTARVSARQTAATAAVSRLPSGRKAFLAFANKIARGCISYAIYLRRKRQRPRIAGASAVLSRYCLFQLGRDEPELRIEGGADTVDGNDDHDRNTGGDQAVFDGGRAGFILHETRNKVLHRIKLHVHVAGRTNVRSHRRSQHRDHGRHPT